MSEEKESSDVDTIVDDYSDQILDLLDEFPEDHDEHVDTAVFICAVQRALDAELSKEEFVELLAGMYEESKEIDELQGRMSLTRGDA